MKPADPARVLVVTDRVGASPQLLDSIRARVARGPAEFHMLVPNPARAEYNPTHPERHAQVAGAELQLAALLPLIEAAAGHPVQGTVSHRHDLMDAVEETLQDERCDELIVAVPPHRIERRL
ncbi:MAG: hypothetical protein QOE11_2225, partial [Solirubrobacteraceae bacterium]|nr:hypothetical protein [Solirubrobacteraceae bacterium]